ncbi:MAG: acyl-CoA hydrolase [Rhodothermales bacterium]|jgi:acyl-CoA hydrolase
MDQEARPVSRSIARMSEIVLPNDTNNLGNLRGGKILHWMDICAAISAQRHSSHVCVTASVDNVQFKSPIGQGEVVMIKSHLNRAFRTSMEIEISVWAENPIAGTKRMSNRAFYTFVAIDAGGTPQPVPALKIESPQEVERYEAAARRREFRLLLSGRLADTDADRLANLIREYPTISD